MKYTYIFEGTGGYEFKIGVLRSHPAISSPSLKIHAISVVSRFSIHNSAGQLVVSVMKCVLTAAEDHLQIICQL